MTGPFLVREAVAHGTSRRSLEAMIRAGQLRRVVPGVLVESGHPDGLTLRAAAVALIRPPGSVLVRSSAAWLHGLDVLEPGEDITSQPLEFAVPTGQTPLRREGCRGFTADVPVGDIDCVAGVLVSTPTRTALDLGRYLPRLHAVAAIDAFAHHGLVEMGELTERAARLSGRRNAARLRSVVDTADAGAESPGESWTRVRLVDAGLPRPRTQVVIHLEDGRVRLDMGYDQWQVGIEFDGEQYHSSAADQAHDEARRAAAERHGWPIVVARKGDVLRDDAHLPAEVAGQLVRRGARLNTALLEQLQRRMSHADGLYRPKARYSVA